MKKNKKEVLLNSFIISISMILISFFVANADVPAVPPGINSINCACVANSSQTCVSKIINAVPLINGQAADTSYYYLNSCNGSNQYITKDPYFFDGAWGNISVANGSLITTEVSPYGPSNFTPLSFNNSYISNVSTSEPTPGVDTGMICVRSGNVAGTLHYTGGSLLKFQQCVENPGGSGTNCYDVVIDMSKQYSCY